MPKDPSERSCDTETILRAMRNSLFIQSHFQLLLWMQGEFQELISHDALIVLSGATGGDTHHYHVVSHLPGIRPENLLQGNIHEFRSGAYQRWAESGRRVVSATLADAHVTRLDPGSLHPELGNMRQLMFHAIPDSRFKADHLYALMRRHGAFSEQDRKLFELLLPHLDAAVRKIDSLPIYEPEEVAPSSLLNSLIKSGLTTREIEILEWVRNGKTNIEIGMILEISSFTVKNHLQRIFKKINVSNRAQAVGKIEEITNSAPSATVN